MFNVSKRMKWGAGTAAAFGCSGVLAWIGFTLGEPAPVTAPSEQDAIEVVENAGEMAPESTDPMRQTVDLAPAVRSANEAADAIYAEQVDAWRAYLVAARSSARLKAFVGELIGLEQKLRQGLELVSGASDEERVRALFRTHVLDERQLASEMLATVEGYERCLFEQDDPILESAGVSPDAWARQVQAAMPTASQWSDSLQPVMARAVSEARKDAARFVATMVAADLAGDGVKKAARNSGWDQSEEGSLDDLISGLVIDLAFDVVIDEITDPTDDIVAKLSQEMARAEYALLDGEEGLFAAMRRLNAAHQAARNSLLTTAQSR